MSPRINEIKLDIEECNKFIQLAQRQKVKDCLSVEVRKLQTELIALQNQEPKDVPKQPNISSVQKSYDIKLKDYAWDQNNEFVKIYVTLNDVQTLPQNSITCDFTERSMELRVFGLNNKNYFLPINNLSENINTRQSNYKIKNNRILINLAKKEQGIRWTCVTSIEKKIKDAKANIAPTNKEDPEASLMELMKKMYQDGDDEMKRTIAKAWTENRDKKSNVMEGF